MDFLYWLEEIRLPWLHSIFSFLTLFGEETLFVIIALLFFWCFDKKQGYFLFFVGFFGTVFNLLLKSVFRVARVGRQD